MSVDGDRSGVDGAAAWSGRLHASTVLHEQFGVGWLDEKTGEAITCDVAKANQQRNLTEGCGRCEMCRSLAYQSPGEKATTTWCVQAEGEPCDAAYKSPICIDPHVRMFPILAAKLLPYMYKTFRQHCLAYPAVK